MTKLENAVLETERSMVKITWTMDGVEYGLITSKIMLEQMKPNSNGSLPVVMEMKVFDD